MDHDFIVSPQHKVILYACKICDVTKVGVLSYNGDTFLRMIGELVTGKPISLMEK